jgi:hypothetical protein
LIERLDDLHVIRDEVGRRRRRRSGRRRRRGGGRGERICGCGKFFDAGVEFEGR